MKTIITEAGKSIVALDKNFEENLKKMGEGVKIILENIVAWFVKLNDDVTIRTIKPRMRLIRTIRTIEPSRKGPEAGRKTPVRGLYGRTTPGGKNKKCTFSLNSLDKPLGL